MTKRSVPLDEDSAVNSVAARLAVYVALAGAAGASVAVALRRHNRKATPDERADEVPDRPAASRLLKSDFHLKEGNGASVKGLHPPETAAAATAAATALTEPGRAGTA